MREVVVVCLFLIFVCCERESPPIISSGPGRNTHDGNGRGYIPRKCGFDMDDDFIVGEAFDDCKVCNGETLDVDGDGVDEDLIYVDCFLGPENDKPGCGAPSSPCSSISYAWNVIADGPDDGAEDIICFRGRCKMGTPNDRAFEAVGLPGTSGIAGSKILPAGCSEQFSFEYPTNPSMLVGWDYDNDGNYPPYDQDDVAILDGTGLRRCIQLNNGGSPSATNPYPVRAGNGTTVKSYVEFAHFSAINYGNGVGGQFMRLGSTADEATHYFFHDFSLVNISRGSPMQSSLGVFFWFGNTQHTWFAFENFECHRCGAYFMRGSADLGLENSEFTHPTGVLRPDTKLRIKNLFYLADGGDGGTTTAAKLWGFLEDVEIIDSYYDGRIMSSYPTERSRAGGLRAGPCSQRWFVRNNHFIDIDATFGCHADGNDGKTVSFSCYDRPVQHLVFEGNLVEAFNYQGDYVVPEPKEWNTGYNALHIASIECCNAYDLGNASPDRQKTCTDVFVSGNFFKAYPPAFFKEVLWTMLANAEGPTPGWIRFINNTIISEHFRSTATRGAITIGDNQYANTFDTRYYPHQNYEILDNLFIGLDGSRHSRVFSILYEPSQFFSDRNMMDNCATFLWDNQGLDSFEEWQSATGQDLASSIVCNCTCSNYISLNECGFPNRSIPCCQKTQYETTPFSQMSSSPHFTWKQLISLAFCFFSCS